jgi:ABC-type bacteriocin/lantibiotic exporter with double-glycine peptidase domain
VRYALIAGAVAFAGCTAYVGGSRPVDALDGPGWIAVESVPYFAQQQEKDCGAAALAMVLARWRADLDLDKIRASCQPDPEKSITAGVLRDYARSLGLKAWVFAGDFKVFEDELAKGNPVLVGMVKPTVTDFVTHYEVVVAFHPDRRRIVTHDPALGRRVYDEAAFLAEWDLLATVKAKNPELAKKLVAEQPSLALARRVTLVIQPGGK